MKDARNGEDANEGKAKAALDQAEDDAMEDLASKE